MKEFVISFYTLAGAYCTVHLKAKDEQEAEQAARDTYWDLQKIVVLEEVK